MHCCHARNCLVEVPADLLMCRRHWSMVPSWLKRDIIAHYQPGQAQGKVTPSDAYRTAVSDAREIVAKREKAMAEQARTRRELFPGAG